MTLPTLEIRIPISPNAHFLRMLRIFAESMHKFGGPIAQSAQIVASVGADEPPFDLTAENPWLLKYPISIRWVPRDEFRQHEYDATGYDRYRVESSADIVVFADADIFVAGNLDRLVLQTHQQQVLYGAVAHVSPFHTKQYQHRSNNRWWTSIFKSAGLPPPELTWRYSDWGYEVSDPNQRFCPPYFNFGFIISPRRHVEQIGTTFLSDLDNVEREIDSWFKSQIANTLSIVRNNIPASELPIKYNFPLNRPSGPFMAKNPDPEGENHIDQIKIFHYLGDGEINKKDFITTEALSKLLRREDLSPASQILQTKLKSIVRELDDF